jgi:ribosomal protein S24E
MEMFFVLQKTYYDLSHQLYIYMEQDDIKKDDIKQNDIKKDDIKQDISKLNGMTKIECKGEIYDTLDDLNTVQRNIETLSNLKKNLDARLALLQRKCDQIV